MDKSDKLPRQAVTHLIITTVTGEVCGVITEIDSGISDMLSRLNAAWGAVPVVDEQTRPISKGTTELFMLGRDYYHVSKEFMLGLSTLFVGLDWWNEVQKLPTFLTEDMRFCFVVYS